MMGDPNNDAPALAAAAVGVPICAGTDMALESAGSALMGERVDGVAELVALSRATLANSGQNPSVAVGLKTMFLATTLAGSAELWSAILADMGVHSPGDVEHPAPGGLRVRCPGGSLMADHHNHAHDDKHDAAQRHDRTGHSHVGGHVHAPANFGRAFAIGIAYVVAEVIGEF